VVLYHAFPQWIPGGFIGVDVFFVVSGFLITHVLIETNKNGGYNLTSFYSSRIRRLFPSMILLFLLLLVFGWFALIDLEFLQLANHILASCGFVANFIFYNEIGYFDKPAITKALIHLWSLSVEAQFYLIWPPLIWTALFFKLDVRKITVLAFIIALACCFWGRPSNIAMFYLPQARMWEFLIGACLASGKFHFNLLKVSSNYSTFLGLCFIIAGIILIDPNSHFFSAWLLLPTLGTALVIAGENSWISLKIFSNSGLALVGLISYPLYLFHWPMLSLANVFSSYSPSALLKIYIILLAFFFAWLFFRFVEMPIRLSRKKSTTIFLSVSLLSIFVAGWVIIEGAGFPQRYVSGLNDYKRISYNLNFPELVGCKIPNLTTLNVKCFNDKDANVLLVGDSHAMQLLYAFKKSENSKFNKPMLVTADMFAPTINYNTINESEKITEFIFNLLKNNSSIQYVVLANLSFNVGHYSKYGDQIVMGLAEFVKKVETFNKKVIWVRDNPSWPNPPDHCAQVIMPFRNWLQPQPEFCTRALRYESLTPPDYQEFTNKLHREVPEMYIFDSRKVFCGLDDRCTYFKDSKLLFTDFHHLSVYGADLLVNQLIKELKPY
jgi:peptidoglycan/LPS O-acetylase OafA/YrhL